MLLALVLLCASGCKKEGGGLTGWYTDLSKPAQQSDFNEINTAINNHELLSSYGSGNNYYATYDLFIDDDYGNYYDGAAYFGRLRNAVNKAIWALQIVDESTLKIYSGVLYPEGGYGTSGKEPYYKLYAGSIFGNMAYYATPTYYTYVKSDNKIVITNGDIYTITSEGLIKDGSSMLLSKYDPTKRYSSGSGGGNSSGGNNGGGNNGGGNGGGNSGGGTNVSGSYNGHDYVDLGLPSGTLWATCNVGASSPEDYGNYYAWGETATKSTCDWSTYKYANGAYNKLTKYCNKSSHGNNGFTDYLTTLQPCDDAARANWGSGWRMPTKEEWKELQNNTMGTWTTQNGVKGGRFTASNGMSVFLPAAGCRYESSLNDAGSQGYYWSSTLNTSYPGGAWYHYLRSGGYGVTNGERSFGRSVRPVRDMSKN